MISITVVTDKDQEVRGATFWWTTGIFVVAGLLVNLNVTSLQGFYKNQIAHTWIVECGGFGRRIPLARLNTTAHGYPYHLISATANFLRRKPGEEGSTAHFLFSNLFCGTNRTGYQPTTEYAGGSYDLASAIALSGAAVSPMGMQNLLLMILLYVLNFRMGQWLPNPGHRPWRPAWLFRAVALWPAPFLVLVSLLRESESRGFCLVTDGGHYENLGIGSLLERRCRMIICADAGYDPKYEFRDFVSMLRRQRVDHGVQIRALDGGVLSFDDLLPDREKRLSKGHYVIARVDYPPTADAAADTAGRGADHGYLVYLKPTFTREMSLDLETQRRVNPDFPHDSSADQFYTPEKFEAYRQLGFEIGERLCREIFAGEALYEWTPRDSSGSESRSGEAETSADRGAPAGETAEVAPERTFPSGQDGGSSGGVELAGEDSSVGKGAANGGPADRVETLVARLLDAEGDSLAETVQALGELLVEEELGAEQRKRAVDALVEVFDSQLDSRTREAVAQMIKHQASYSRKVRRAACSRALDRDDDFHVRVAALDLLDAIGLETKAAVNAVDKLQRDPNPMIAAFAEDIHRRHAADRPS